MCHSTSLRRADRRGPRQGLDWLVSDQFLVDEKRFLWEMGPSKLSEQAWPNHTARFLTAVDAWERHQGPNKPNISFVRLATPAKMWSSMRFFDFSYLRLTPHQFWWGQTGRPDQTMSPVPPEKASWESLAAETFGGELCDVVESALRAERLWIGKESGRIRGVASYRLAGSGPPAPFYKTERVARIAGKPFRSQQEYSNWYRQEATAEQVGQITVFWSEFIVTLFPAGFRPNELVQFDDYRRRRAGRLAAFPGNPLRFVLVNLWNGQTPLGDRKEQTSISAHRVGRGRGAHGRRLGRAVYAATAPRRRSGPGPAVFRPGGYRVPRQPHRQRDPRASRC